LGLKIRSREGVMERDGILKNNNKKREGVMEKRDPHEKPRKRLCFPSTFGKWRRLIFDIYTY
jgi:hypothetical protein